MGESRPRLKMLTSAGPLLLIGGRDVVSGRGDAILWVNYAADGIAWQDHSLSGRHNALLPARRQSWAFSPMVNLVSQPSPVNQMDVLFTAVLVFNCLSFAVPLSLECDVR